METSPITDEIVRVRNLIGHTAPVALSNRDLTRVIRLRLMSDPGFPMWDLSYCYGQMRDGTFVRVALPVHQFPKSGLSRSLVEMCKQAGRYAKGLGMLDNVSLTS